MKKNALLAFLFIMAIAFTTVGCATYQSPVIPGIGSVTAIKAPQDIDFEKTDLGTKQGRSSVHTILGLIAFGDCSTEAAASDGQIKTIKHSDYSYFNLLGLYACYTTIVYGD